MAQRGVNKVILIGNLGADPELRHTSNDSSVANVRLATSETWKDKSTGEQKEQTEWHTVVFFGRLAEVVGEYLRKGSKIYVEGRLRTRKWQDKEGNDRYSTEVVGDEMQMLDSAGSRDSGGDRRDRGDDRGRSGRRAASANAVAGQRAPVQEDFDDDIPF